jgi:tetratricopeptide (TPR) repeat protein
MIMMAVVDGRVPGYLGRVLDSAGEPVATCFQVAPGVLVTAWHVLDDILAAAVGAEIWLDPLAGGQRFTAAVARVDPVRDLAILTCDARLPAVAAELAATDQMALRTAVTVTGHCVVDDPGRTARSLTAIGQWAGPATWEDAVPVGRMTADAVLPGMSGAPVVRDSDGAVAGVVSGRYNSADGWLAGTVWVARTEDLLPLLAGVADVSMQEITYEDPVDLLLEVTGEHVRLTGAGIGVSATHGGVRPGLAGAVIEVRRARAWAGMAVRTPAQVSASAGELSLARAGRLLGESFLPSSVASELKRVLAAAERGHQRVRLGLQVPRDLAVLPWECLPLPGDHGPLALHPLVSLYRKADARAARVSAGPLRIVVAIAAPDAGGGPVLDYERELRNVLAAVRSARQDAADVRVVPFATVAAIRKELDRGPVHVLHVSGHGSPGILDLEADDGTARPVTAEQFVAQAIPPGRMPPVITLSACYTDAAGTQDGASFAARLCRHGAAAVIATETSVTDAYATRLLARVYAALARARDSDVVAALADARREVQAELETSTDQRDTELAALGEWAAVTILAGSGSVILLDAGAAVAPATGGPSRPRIAGLAGRHDWYFVGRRAEQRRWPAELTGTPGLAGIVVTGIGGTGKTTLAAELTARVREDEPGRVLVSLTGPLTLEGLLGAVISAVRRELLVAGQDAEAVRALDVAARADLPWADRLAVLRERVLDHVSVLAVLDNFEDNLRSGGAGYAVGDEVLAGLLAAWVADPGKSRLLITSRHPFALPGGAEQSLSFRQLGALSRAETMKLAWSLPALDRLDEAQLDQVWRLAGGHPRSLEYLDALLAAGTARYPDVTARLGEAVADRLEGASMQEWLAARTALDAALAEVVSLAADDVLLDGLLERLSELPGAEDLLLGASVYREPVDGNALLFQVGQPDDAAARIREREAAEEHIVETLTSAGISTAGPIDLASLPPEIHDLLVPDLAELQRRPAPPLLAPTGLPQMIEACQASSLLTVNGSGGDRVYFVHRWTATELEGRASRGRDPWLAEAHRHAADYWQWRVQVWPQGQALDLHDSLEARYHLQAAGDIEKATQISDSICEQLHTWGAWDEEFSIILDTMARLPGDSPLRRQWAYYRGRLAQNRGDYAEAEREYQRALDINERIGDEAGISSSHHNLGVIANLRGDYSEAERQIRFSLDIDERIGDEAGKAISYSELGALAQLRGDYAEAEREFRRAIDIHEGIGDQAALAGGYHNLGILAYERGDYAEAEREYRRALDINERIGNQAGVAAAYHQLGQLARRLDDYAEAEREYRRALDINDRIGNQAGMAASYHDLGILAQLRGDYPEAEREFRRALDINERIGNQAGMANGNGSLGILAQMRGDYAEAEREYRRALDINERIGNQAGIATTYSALGLLETGRDAVGIAITWHVKAIAIKLRLGLPGARDDLRQLAEHRAALGPDRFVRLLTDAAGHQQAEAIDDLLNETGVDPAVDEDA